MEEDGPEVRDLAKVQVSRISPEDTSSFDDTLIVEEPLEIRVAHHWRGKRLSRSISVTMRTPGDDHELATGFLWTEGILRDLEDIASVRHVTPKRGRMTHNVVEVELRDDARLHLERVERHVYTSSSCGVCGKASIDAVSVTEPERADDITADASHITPLTVVSLPERLREAQALFEASGGVHGAGLFDAESGSLLAVREDVGRHNAVDKVVGQMRRSEFGGSTQPDGQHQVLVLSGRVGFELVQKAVMARIPMIVAVGAPSSLARDLAQHFGVTLIGFVRHRRFNAYTHAHRVVHG